MMIAFTVVLLVKEKLGPPSWWRENSVISSAGKSRWSLKTNQFKDDSAKTVLLTCLLSEVLCVITQGA